MQCTRDRISRSKGQFNINSRTKFTEVYIFSSLSWPLPHFFFSIDVIIFFYNFHSFYFKKLLKYPTFDISCTLECSFHSFSQHLLGCVPCVKIGVRRGDYNEQKQKCFWVCGAFRSLIMMTVVAVLRAVKLCEDLRQRHLIWTVTWKVLLWKHCLSWDTKSQWELTSLRNGSTQTEKTVPRPGGGGR